MGKKYYAVRVGRETGIFDTWAECQKQTAGFSGAEFKSFKTKEEALSYAGGFASAPSNGQTTADANITPEFEAVAYVDGSYMPQYPTEFSYGLVLFWNGEQYEMSERFCDADLASMRNVAGEIKGAEAAMQFALDHNICELAIYHDYQGISAWCTGAWQAKKEGTKAYKQFYDTVCKTVNIHFVKVKGHSGDEYNDLADALAKRALIH